MKCNSTTWDGWRSRPCENRANYGAYCGVHSPVQKAKRAKARGPTQFERDCTTAKEDRKHVKAMETALAEIASVVRDPGRFRGDGAMQEVAMISRRVSKSKKS